MRPALTNPFIDCKLAIGGLLAPSISMLNYITYEQGDKQTRVLDITSHTHPAIQFES